jgi:hypothetical protein
MSTKDKLQELLVKTFDAYRDGLEKEVPPEVYERLKFDFVFHMTDWHEDLAKLSDLYAQPEKWSAKDASSVVGGFLIHVIWHIESAQKLLLGDDMEAIEAENLEPQPTRQ